MNATELHAWAAAAVASAVARARRLAVLEYLARISALEALGQR